MDTISLIYYAAQCCCAAAVLVAAIKSKKPLRSLLISALTGSAAFFAVNATGVFTSVSLGINAYTVCISIFGGVPGVIMLLVMRLLCL